MAALLAHGQLLERLSARLAHLLPAPLDEHVRVMNLREGNLVLQVDSAAWATRARFVVNHVLQRWAREMGEIPQPRSIQIRIAVAPPPPAPLPPAPRLSEENAQLLQRTADNIADSRLQSALLRLARNSGLGNQEDR